MDTSTTECACARSPALPLPAASSRERGARFLEPRRTDIGQEGDLQPRASRLVRHVPQNPPLPGTLYRRAARALRALDRLLGSGVFGCSHTQAECDRAPLSAAAPTMGRRRERNARFRRLEENRARGPARHRAPRARAHGVGVSLAQPTAQARRATARSIRRRRGRVEPAVELALAGRRALLDVFALRNATDHCRPPAPHESAFVQENGGRVAAAAR